MPKNPEVTRRLRRKETLPEEAARAGVPFPQTLAADSEETLRALDLRPPYLLKPVEGQHFAGSFGQKVIEAATLDELVVAWREAQGARVRHGRPGADPGGAREDLVAVRVHRPSGAHAGDGDRREGAAGADPLRDERGLPDGAEPRVRELGLKLLETAGYQGFGHVEFAHDHRDDEFKLLEVNTRVPMWAGMAMSRFFDMARIAYDDLCGKPEPEPRHFEGDVSWSFLAKDLHSSLAMARRRELGPREFLRPVPAPAQGARGDGEGRPAAGARGRAVPDAEALVV